MNRRVESELLDHLPPLDPLAKRSRQDLHRLNRLMGHASIVGRLLQRAGHQPGRIIELGAGDGCFALDLARSLARQWRNVEIMLVDRVNIVTPDTIHAFASLGWTARVVEADVFDWLTTNREAGGCVVVNLFLHHFADTRLGELLALVARSAVCLVACEPRRSPAVLTASRLLGLIGCNAVTRHDAVASVRAGFMQLELSNLWPAGDGWLKDEKSAGLFSHSFLARRSALRR